MEQGAAAIKCSVQASQELTQRPRARGLSVKSNQTSEAAQPLKIARSRGAQPKHTHTIEVHTQ